MKTQLAVLTSVLILACANTALAGLTDKRNLSSVQIQGRDAILVKPAGANWRESSTSCNFRSSAYLLPSNKSYKNLYAALLAAQLSGAKVRLHFDSDECVRDGGLRVTRNTSRARPIIVNVEVF